MPMLVPSVTEFMVVRVDGEEVSPEEAGRLRITDRENEQKIEIKPCGEEGWRKPRKGDMDFLRRVLAKCEGEEDAVAAETERCAKVAHGRCAFGTAEVIRHSSKGREG